METNKIHNVDCIEYMKTLPNNCVNLIIADPPYYQIVKNDWDNQWKTEDDYYEWCNQWIKECFRVLATDGSMYIWNWFDNICDIGVKAKRNGFIIRNLITWNRGAGREKYNWCSAKEELLYLIKDIKQFTFNLSDVLLSIDDENRKMKKSSWERCQYVRKDRKNFADNNVNPSNVWFDNFINAHSKEKVNHPTQKPISVCDRIIKASSNENDIVYIPFAGSGSEIVSCINNNRNWIATETNQQYIDEVIVKRLN